MARIRWLQDLTLDVVCAELGRQKIPVKKGDEAEVILRGIGKGIHMTLARHGTIDGPEVAVNTTDFMVLEYHESEKDFWSKADLQQES